MGIIQRRAFQHGPKGILRPPRAKTDHVSGTPDRDCRTFPLPAPSTSVHLRCPCRRRPCRAFSFADVLALLAAGTVLGLLLGSTLARGGAESRVGTCLENFRTLGRAWALYAADHGDRVVNNLTLSETQFTIQQKAYATWANNVLDWSTAAQNTNLSLMATGQLARYLGTGPEVFKCPSDTFRSPAQTRQGWTGRVRSYSMNAFMGANYRSDAKGISSLFPAYRQFHQSTGIPDPSRKYLFLDEHPDSINDGVYFVNPTQATSWGDTPAAYHDGAANFSFADGHAETHAWLAPTNIPPVRYQYTSLALRGAAKDDFAWVANRQTVPASALAAFASEPGGRQLRLVWSQFSTNRVVQRAADPATGPWTNVPVSPVKSVGQWSVTLPSEDASGFLRLGPP